MKALKEIRSVIIAVCEEQPAIMAAYLFGSVALGTAKASSDVDVALLLDDRKSDSFSLLACITRLEDLLECHVDVVIVNSANELLKYEVRRSGKVIFDRSPEFRKAFEIRSRKAYEDFLYLHKRYVRKVLYGLR
ncbi:MAG: nucleotidyltransferase domain-containing protein [bacterium]|nr:nucleotidyltransferase domain-containing protein [bacterium]